MWKKANMVQKAVVIIVIAVTCVLVADTGYGYYAFTSARQECNYHLLYNIPGRGRLTADPYSSEELAMIRLDCQAYGLEGQVENVRLPFNQSRIDNRLADIRAECVLETDYIFNWGCD